MTYRTLLTLLFINVIFLNLTYATSAPCDAMGTDTSFEHIRQISLNTIDNTSENDGGFGNYSNITTELVAGESYEVSLIPGYKDDEFNEAWSIWIDFNNDGDFEDEGEELLSLIDAGRIDATIKIPENVQANTMISMRVAMKYKDFAQPCEIFTFGEVEDYSITIAGETNPCKDFITGGFEEGYGDWNDGSIDCTRVTEHANSGNWSVRIRDNSGAASSITSKNLDFSAYQEITIDFSYYPNSMEEGEDFWLQISTDGGDSFSTVKEYVSGKDFINETRYFESVNVNDIELSERTQIRLRCDASGNADQVFIDDIAINACSIADQSTIIESIEQEIKWDVDPGDLASKTYESNNVENNETTVEFGIYPNPAIDRVSFKILEGKSINASYDIKLMDLYGNIVKNQRSAGSLENYNLDISELINGMYLMIIESEDGYIATHKVMVRK